MLSYLKVLRPKNLMIVGVTQFLLYFFIILPHISQPALNYTLFSLLVLDTMIIAASGFLINDIFDYKSDQINKPNSTYIPDLISLNNAKYVYYGLSIIGLFLAIYIAIKINTLGQVVIYPIAVLMLYAYSAKYKNSILIGNILVSAFISMVSGIVLFAERNQITALESNKNLILEIFTFYMVFSFLINLAREIVKDIEDMDGDKNMDINTLPIKYGIKVSKTIAMSLCTTLIILLSIWMLLSEIPFSFRAYFFIILFLIAPLGWTIQKLKTARFKKDYSRISHIYKLIMIAGLCSLILIAS